ncbi:replication protein A 70 kDa DNA-binding subunit D-like [Pyrus ussuriensis x Pyrus communis]|uniref:Replication protein A 70 kDa DNA-binding subunit D-like n=1 Tax=Pyrus ussuriensis x Pyrus communis TaxID=2448454 RepID=A0A5N5GY68_9ROSA|nr:replication protein A 70 kDa DNA-binding subunit D-like [Pyrus ussuriensis x Pyrus communis]
MQFKPLQKKWIKRTLLQRLNLIMFMRSHTFTLERPLILEALEPLTPPVLDVFTSLKVKRFKARQLMRSEELENAEKMSVQDLNVLDPDLYKNTLVLCRAAITCFDTHAGWWYKACPCCYKQLRKDENNDVLICVKHNVQIPLPWFKVCLILEDVRMRLVPSSLVNCCQKALMINKSYHMQFSNVEGKLKLPKK